MSIILIFGGLVGTYLAVLYKEVRVDLQAKTPLLPNELEQL